MDQIRKQKRTARFCCSKRASQCVILQRAALELLRGGILVGVLGGRCQKGRKFEASWDALGPGNRDQRSERGCVC
jgi:hypothetical protein